MRMGIAAIIVIAVIATLAPSLHGHHSFAAVFDSSQPVELTGTVTKVEWTNPHVWFYLDVTRDGKVENWSFEMGSPSGLTRRGWKHTTLQAGQVITVAAMRARDGTPRAAVRTVTLSTGESLFGAQVVQ